MGFEETFKESNTCLLTSKKVYMNTTDLCQAHHKGPTKPNKGDSNTHEKRTQEETLHVIKNMQKKNKNLKKR